MKPNSKELRAFEREVEDILNHVPPRLTKKQIANRMVRKTSIAEVKQPDGIWSVDERWHKDLFPGGDKSKLSAMGEKQLVETIKTANGEAIQLAKKSLLHAGRAGMAMIALKELCQHGTFGIHLKAIGIEPRTAQNYMQIARNYETVSHLRGVRDALRYIKDASSRAAKADEAETEAWTAGHVSLDYGPSPEPTTVEVKAEVIEAEPVEQRVKVISHEAVELEPSEQAHAKPKADDPFLRILQLLPELSQEQFRELVKIIQTRWIR